MSVTKKKVDQLSFNVLGAAIEVHRCVGPGLLESVYHRCIESELARRGIGFATGLTVPVIYKGKKLETDLRCDLFVEGLLVVELKTVTALLPVHEAQLWTYMTLLDAPKGILINFYCTNIFKEGQKTLVNERYRQLPST